MEIGQYLVWKVLIRLLAAVQAAELQIDTAGSI